ncbi:MAG: phosphotransferase family protein [Candidatus Omnitrophica bacterium]|nr:phosphotransferase family protein [Candidatus Omnitrophota bacterium]
MAAIDTATKIRHGEELDESKLEAFLRERIEDPGEGFSIRQFPGGHSNLTYQVTLGENEYVLRRPPFGSKVKGAHDMGREFTVLSHLSKVYPQAPTPILFCQDPEVIGADFYLMQRIQGVIYRNRKPDDFNLSQEQIRETCVSFVKNLVHLHSIDYEAAGLAELKREGQYTERQVMGWSKRYFGSKTDEVLDIEATSKWLQERIPPDSGSVIVHNDYKFDNIVLDPDDNSKIIGVLDWEMTTIGDPLMDLGTALGYWAENEDEDEIKVVQSFLTTLPGALNRQELADLYASESGRPIPELTFYYVFALFKLAVIVQQIYYRYHHGFTQDPRFASMIDMVYALGKKSQRAIESNSIRP